MEAALNGNEVDLRVLLRESENILSSMVRQCEFQASRREFDERECNETALSLKDWLQKWRRNASVALEAEEVIDEETHRATAFASQLEKQLRDLQCRIDEKFKSTLELQSEISKIEKSRRVQ